VTDKAALRRVADQKLATLARFATEREMTNSRCVRAVRPWGGTCAALTLVVLAAGCTGGARAELSTRGARRLAPGVVTTITVPPEETTTTTVPPEPLPGLQVGSSGAEVLTLERKLASLKYIAGQVDEAFDADTRDAVMAFQKVTGMERTGRATDDVVAAVNAAIGTPPPLVPAGGVKRVEIDLDRQVLFHYEGNSLSFILPVSTGSNERFCSEGWCRRAVTPPGSFLLYEQRSGWEKSPLGWLYNSQYFNGGIAIHGSQSVPGYPASHGCVRIPMNAAEWFPDRVSVNMPVYVVAAGAPTPEPISPNAAPVSTPTTVVPDRPASTTTIATTTTTTPNLLDQLLRPPTTRRLGQ
jgi:peptidoglycan hydrolase-like protein with peptidoglycan-binding domain